MVDRDPLERWGRGKVTLLGDAAHLMYPVGANGASQAILDASALAFELTSRKDVETAFTQYESARRPVTSKIVLENRLRDRTERTLALSNSNDGEKAVVVEGMVSRYKQNVENQKTHHSSTEGQ
jgi:2-polyprenyl-6-methoxyphenol hydroxylase-like FAD-dependent oxidoreductase